MIQAQLVRPAVDSALLKCQCNEASSHITTILPNAAQSYSYQRLFHLQSDANLGKMRQQMSGGLVKLARHLCRH